MKAVKPLGLLLVTGLLAAGCFASPQVPTEPPPATVSGSIGVARSESPAYPEKSRARSPSPSALLIGTGLIGLIGFKRPSAKKQAPEDPAFLP